MLVVISEDKYTRIFIEDILEIKDGVYIMIRYVSGEKNFSINHSSRINNLPLDLYLDIPRLIDSNGQQIYDVFAIKLLYKDDRCRLSKNKYADLLTKQD